MGSVAQLEAEISTYFRDWGGYIWPPGIPVLIEIWVSNSYWRTWPQLLITLWKFCVAHSISFWFIIKNVCAVYVRCMRGECAVNARCLREKFPHTWSVCRININTNGGYQVSCWKWMRVNIESLASLATKKLYHGAVHIFPFCTWMVFHGKVIKKWGFLLIWFQIREI